MRKILVFGLGILFGTSFAFSQAPKKLSSSEIHQSIEKLNFLGTALYLAAHPDDENTRLISYLSNHMNARTAYLALTRGDGGQNLIGPEIRELLGVLRTQELLGARRVDGGEQYFSRANDFGFSKHPDETLKIWNKKEVLGDVVWAIRNLKPDVIINRFDHRTPGSTHGHHTSSAMLSVEAFDLANNPDAYPEQLKSTTTWQPKRAFFNTSWWFYGSQENFEKADKSKMVSMDVGVYYPSVGLSNNEIASMASNNHLCQGFGRIMTRGSQDEYIELVKGDMPNDQSNVFDGINTTWSRVKGGKAVGDILYAIEENYDFTDPAKHLPQLIEAYKLIQDISDEHWRNIKIKEIKKIILAVSGLYLEASAQEGYTNPGETVKVNIEVLNRSSATITLSSVSLSSDNVNISNTLLEENKKTILELDLNVPESTAYSSPYWLNEKGSLGMYTVKDKSLIGKPETPRPFNAHFVLDFDGYPITFMKPVIYHYSKPDKGEIYQAFEVLPKVTASMNDDVIIFASSKSRDVSIKIKAGKDSITGHVQLKAPSGWQVLPEKIDFTINQKGDAKTVVFSVSPPEMESEGEINPIITVDNQTFTKELIEIAYDHIPTQSVLFPSNAKVVRLNIQKVGENIGYIVGAGDNIPESLKQIGYTVHTIDPNTIQEGSLSKYDGIVVGIRAYNVVKELKFKQHFLLDYVKEGGNLIIQYNTSGRRGLGIDNIAPYPLTVSRDRVTDENSDVTILAKNHSLVNFPNPITQKDFNGWVQERGLYFPNEWGKEFTPILSMADKGESIKEGALLVAPYGKGNYIYTGLSFFRELPAGVSGAYKIFANMLSLGKGELEKNIDIKR